MTIKPLQYFGSGSTGMLIQCLIDLHQQDEHNVILHVASKAYKEVNKAPAPIDISSSAF